MSKLPAHDAPLLSQVTELLKRLDRGSTTVGEAIEELAEIAFEGRQAELVRHVEPFDGSRQYMALIPMPSGGTLSVAYGSLGLPWPMRGVHRWSEADVVRVDGRTIRMDEAVAHLELDDPTSGISERLIDAALIKNELASRPVDVSLSEIQVGLDRFRRDRGLLTAQAIADWLRITGRSHADLERLVADGIRIEKLKERLANHGMSDFSSWLTERRRAARIEWFWGRSSEEESDGEP